MYKVLKRPINFMLETCPNVSQICAPLLNLNITFFSYTKIYKDGSRIDINNSPIAAKNYYENERYMKAVMESDPFAITDKFLLWSIFPEDKAIKTCRDYFNIDYGITIVDKYEDFCELSHFATTRNNYSIVNFYLNNLDILKTFIIYFKDKAQDLIRKFETNKIKIISNENDNKEKENRLYPNLNIVSSSLKKEFLNSLEINKFFLINNNNEIYLTKRETECLHWCVLGKSASEIAILLNISPRTVESHLSTVKLKLNCTKQSQLVRSYHRIGIEDFFLLKNVRTTL